MSADNLLSRLDGVRRTGDGRWLARCPSHEDRSPSLSVRECDDGRVLVHCFGGCCVEEILGAVGLSFDDLYPPRQVEHGKRERRPFLPSDVFEIARFEVSVVVLIACDMHKQRALTEDDYARLHVASARLSDIAGAAYGR